MTAEISINNGNSKENEMKYYLVDGTVFEKVDDVSEYICDNADNLNSDAYDDWLDEISGDVQIGTLTYSASQVLKEVDPVAYRCGFNDWIDAELRDLRYELERMDPGDSVDVLGFYIEVCETEDDEQEDSE